jgi:hypothetical protein
MYQLHDSIVRACGLEVEEIRRNAATSKECMDKQTHTHLLQQHSAQQRQKAADTTLVRARKEVEINGHGTSGYVIKQGEHQGTVLGHIQRKPAVI